MVNRRGGGFILGLLFHLLQWFEFPLLAGILFVLSKTGAAVPAWTALIPLGIWLLLGLVLTVIVLFANRSSDSNSGQPAARNINPYSHKNSDFMSGTV